MYLTDEDYKTLITENDLDAILEADADKRLRAEQFARDEVASYLRMRYRIGSEYEKEGTARNGNLLMKVLDCTLYHLSALMPERMGLNDLRQKRYEQAIRWLERVEGGRADAGIPALSDPEPGGTDPEQSPEYYNQTRWGSLPRNDYTW